MKENGKKTNVDSESRITNLFVINHVFSPNQSSAASDVLLCIKLMHISLNYVNFYADLSKVNFVLFVDCVMGKHPICCFRIMLFY